jgi:predicted nucleotidyltransferase
VEFERAIAALCDAGVDFIVIGGVSAFAYGSSRVTFDLDICYSRTKENISRLAAALAPFKPRPRDFPAGLPFVWDESTLRNGGLFTLQTEIGDLDLLPEVAGVGTFDDALPNSSKLEIYGREVLNLNLRTLIAAKLAAGRPKDLDDVRALKAILETIQATKAESGE